MSNSIFVRTSVRAYKEKQVEEEKIQKILRAAMAAPTAGNQQPWVFYVIKDKKVMREIAQCSPYAGCITKAQLAFVICYNENVKYPEYVQIDCAISCENILLQIETEKLGGVLLGIAPLKDRMNRVEALLNLPNNIHAFAVIPCGYPLKKEKQADRFDANKVNTI